MKEKEPVKVDISEEEKRKRRKARRQEKKERKKKGKKKEEKCCLEQVDIIVKEKKDEDVVHIVVISDTHNRHGLLEMPPLGGDILIHAGDFTNKGTEHRDYYASKREQDAIESPDIT